MLACYRSFHTVRERVSETWLAARLAIFLCLLPILLRIYSLPRLLLRLGKPSQDPWGRFLQFESIVQVVRRVSNLPFLRPPLFPRSCLLHSLIYYHALRGAGYTVQIHFGIRRTGAELQGHSWLTIPKTAAAQGNRMKAFNTIFSYPSTSFLSSGQEANRIENQVKST
jgi:hypothetical protein